VLLAVGTLFMATIGRRMLPTHAPHAGRGGSIDDLRRLYQLDNRLFSLRIPQSSHLDGTTIEESRLGLTLGIKVLSIVRGHHRELAPSPATRLKGGDLLLVQGSRDDVEELLRVQGVEVERAEAADLPPVSGGFGGIRARLQESSDLVGRSLRDLDFRERFGLVVVGVRRDGQIRRENLAGAVLQAGDVIFALGARERLEELRQLPDFDVRETGFSAVQQLQDKLFAIRVPATSQLAGQRLEDTGLSELAGVTIGGVIRGGETLPAPGAEDHILAGDQLLVAGEPLRIVDLLEMGRLELEAPEPGTEIESEAVGVVEAALAPRSSAVGKTLRELDFRRKQGLLALVLWREGQLNYSDLADIPLHLGDALLLQGPRERIAKLAADPDFVVLTHQPVPRRSSKAPFALGGLLLMVALVVAGIQPIHVAAFTAASLVVLSGALTMEEAYRAIEWRAIFLVAAVLPVGIAMERTGAALMMADSVTSIAGSLGPYAVLASLVVLASLLSQGLDGAPAVVLLTPVVLQAAETLGLSPYPLMMGISLAASAAFMTPFSHKANLLVMGAGGYHSRDYLRVGTPLTIVLLALMVLMIPIFFPFHP
jgi:di/tricarboxylate transporter